MSSNLSRRRLTVTDRAFSSTYSALFVQMESTKHALVNV